MTDKFPMAPFAVPRRGRSQFLAILAALLLGTPGMFTGCGDKSGNTGTTGDSDDSDIGLDDPDMEVSENDDLSGESGEDHDGNPGESDDPQGFPTALPFSFERPPQGDAPTAADVTTFTKALTGLWKKARWFTWMLETSHGMDASHGQRDFMVWWTGVAVDKANGKITFRHTPEGGPDNIMIPTSKALAGAVGAHLLTNLPDAARVVEQYAKGTTGTMLGMVWDANDPLRSIMARAVMPDDHVVTLPDGRQKRIDYAAWRRETVDWNTHTIRVPTNPYWGDIWVKNMRSKDDVPHILRTAGWLALAAEKSSNAAAREAATEAWEYLKGFCADIVEHGYRIRTKDKNGVVYSPVEDLASFVDYDWMGPQSECTAKLTAHLIAYDHPGDLDCGDGRNGAYENAAVAVHYYNLPIIQVFHLSAILHALRTRHDAVAERLLKGFADRVDGEFLKPDNKLGTPRDNFEGDLAALLVQAASLGLPLTGREAKLVQRRYSEAAAAMIDYPRWNVWDPSVPDGTHDYRPRGIVDVAEMIFPLEYCASPFRNPARVEFIDCAVVADPARWGE